MIVLSDVHEPTENIHFAQPQVEAFLDSQSLGQGTIYVSESVTWIHRETKKGFSLTYPSIILHATSTDLSNFPREHIFVLVDCSKAEPRRRCAPLFTAEEAARIQNLNINDDDDMTNGEDEEEDADSETSPSAQIRFVPVDTSCLQQIYEAMSTCQELNPNESDISDDEEEADEAGIVNLEDGQMPEGGQWFTAENIEQGNFELSAQGIANLQRMMGGGGGGSDQNNGHAHEEHDDEQMDDS